VEQGLGTLVFSWENLVDGWAREVASIVDIVQKNRNFLKEYWILRNILLPFNRIRIWFSNILLSLKGSRIKVMKLLLQQNFNRIFSDSF